jgi:carbon storage regulator
VLALTRKVGEQIYIGDNIIVTIVDIRGDSLRIAIDAPKEVKIYRGEIYQAIVAENKRATTPVDLTQLEVLKNIPKRED